MSDNKTNADVCSDLLKDSVVIVCRSFVDLCCVWLDDPPCLRRERWTLWLPQNQLTRLRSQMSAPHVLQPATEVSVRWSCVTLCGDDRCDGAGVDHWIRQRGRERRAAGRRVPAYWCIIVTHMLKISNTTIKTLTWMTEMLHQHDLHQIDCSSSYVWSLSVLSLTLSWGHGDMWPDGNLWMSLVWTLELMWEFYVT